MKRFLSVLMSFVLIFALFAPIYTSFSEKTQRKSVERFCSAVTELTKKYDDNVFYKTDDAGGAEASKPVNVSANRLIVKTGGEIKDTAAIDCVYGLDYAVLQYANQGDMISDCEKLKGLGYTVDKDYVITAFEDKITAGGLQASEMDKSSGLVKTSEEYDYAQSACAKARFSGCKEEIVVGIMDTGIDYNHSEFTGRYVHNPVNFGTSGTADDPMDDHYHGTACASIVTQSTPENVKVKPYKILDKNGSATEINVILACEYILAETDKPDVINMSFGGYAKNSEGFGIIDNIIEELVASGISVCTAAANDALPADYAHPACCPSVINAASGYIDGLSSFSNYGDTIDVTAPGENIYVAECKKGYSDEHSGTSFSAPFVSAACAYVLMQNPNATPAEVKERIKATAVNMGEEDSFYYGAGLLSFANLTCGNTLQTPSPSVSGGLYHEAQTIEFNNIPEGTYLVYTVYTLSDGIINNEYSKVYTEPFTIDRDAKLIYALMSGNEYVSPITTQDYRIQYYTQSSDFTIIAGVITKYKGDKTNIVVPDKIALLKPTGINKELFMNSNLTSIVLPDSVTTLGTSSFQGASKLRHIVARGVTKFSGDSVFLDCADLRDEIMPKLKTVTASAFKNCKRLHSIDFAENLTEFTDSLFYKTGLIHGDFPNAKDTAVSSVFTGCPLFSCKVPHFKTLHPSFFRNCSLLNELEIGQITEICDSALYNCYLLKEIDTSQLTTINKDALKGCCLDVLYAPKCTVLPAGFGQYCQVRVIDLPNAEGAVASAMLNCSGTEELYLERASSVSRTAFKNAINLNILYLPNSETYYEPYTNVSTIDKLIYGERFYQKPPLEIIWVPKAQLPESISCNKTRLLYAPSAESVALNTESAETVPNIVLSDKAGENGIHITGSEGAVIVAPEGSYAQRYSADSSCNYTFVSTDDVRYSQRDGRKFFTYITDGSDFSVPNRLISPYWQKDVINKNADSLFYGFLLDFTDDNILNAKDYGVLEKY